ncbi:hypothetical protein O9929_25555 [Vibrio lentus]|nr:hypothetical protein [Vibrio lentus]
MKIRAEDGHVLYIANLSNYINHLPMQRTRLISAHRYFKVSTSQAAWLQESIEAGVQTLLIGEDTSATNFMIRDERMQALVSKGAERNHSLLRPYWPTSRRDGYLDYRGNGGSGDYLDVADTVIQMHDYQSGNLC